VCQLKLTGDDLAGITRVNDKALSDEIATALSIPPPRVQAIGRNGALVELVIKRQDRAEFSERDQQAIRNLLPAHDPDVKTQGQQDREGRIAAKDARRTRLAPLADGLLADLEARVIDPDGGLVLTNQQVSDILSELRQGW
jgi:hypothetical protein